MFGLEESITILPQLYIIPISRILVVIKAFRISFQVAPSGGIWLCHCGPDHIFDKAHSHCEMPKQAGHNHDKEPRRYVSLPQLISCGYAEYRYNRSDDEGCVMCPLSTVKG